MAILNQAGRLIKKYRIFFIVFWICALLSDIHLYKQSGLPLETVAWVDMVSLRVCEALCVYLIIYLLVPRYMNKQRYTRFFLLSITCMLLTAVLSVCIRDLAEVRLIGHHFSLLTWYMMFPSFVCDTLVITGIFVAVITIPERYRTEQRNRDLERERLETELNFLKAQINPHFLFNALNSIYVLIGEDTALAEKTLLNFSGLLRYQLYDCTNNLVSLNKEIDFLNDYVKLETIRQGEGLEVTIDIQPETRYMQIAPFILMPFVENAFKHISHEEANFVKIKMHVADEALIFSITNTYSEDDIREMNRGGIGLKNVARRLQLLYPNAHKLEINKTGKTYNVTLQLMSDEHAMYHSG